MPVDLVQSRGRFSFAAGNRGGLRPHRSRNMAERAHGRNNSQACAWYVWGAVAIGFPGAAVSLWPVLATPEMRLGVAAAEPEAHQDARPSASVQ